MLRIPSRCSCLMLKAPLSKMKKNPTTMIFYFILWLVLQGLLFIFVYPTTDMARNPNILWVYIISGSAILSLFCAIFAAIKNPGYLTKPKIPFIQLLDKFDSTMLCPECEVIRTARSRHCSICNQCVERFDHHCPWINNCVGVKNHYLFVFFLMFTEAALVLIIILLAIKVKSYMDVNQAHHWIYFIAQHMPASIYEEKVLMGVKIGMIAVCALFALPLLVLLLVQMKNLCLAQTTNERFGAVSKRSQFVKKKSGTLSSDDSFQSEENEAPRRRQSSDIGHVRGTLDNCWEMCCQHEMKDQNTLYNDHLLEDHEDEDEFEENNT